MEVTNQDIDKLSKKEDIKKEIDKVKPQAEQLSKDPDKLEKFLIEAEEYCQKIPGVGDDLATIPTLIRLVRDYCNKSYTDIPTGTIIAIIAALIYVVSPVDIIPDELIPVIGFVDDAAVVKFCIEMIKNDLNKYKQWKENNKMNIKKLNEKLERVLKNKKLNEDFYPKYTLAFFDTNTDELIQEPIPYETEQGALYAYNKAKESLDDSEYVELSKHVGEGSYEPIKNSSWFEESFVSKRKRKVSESAGDKYLKISYDGKEIDVYTITRYMGNIIPEDFDITKFKIEILDSQNL